MKNIIREVSEPDFEFYFDGDCFNSNSGDFCNTFFMIHSEWGRHWVNYNEEEYNDVSKECSYVLTEVYDKINGHSDAYRSIKEIMEDYNLPYNPKNAHILKGLSAADDYHRPEVFSAYLTVKTGKEWKVIDSRGICQRDYADLVFCPSNYSDKMINIVSDLYWGMGKEFAIQFDGEDYFVFGYYIADCEYRSYDDIKTYICEGEGLDEENTVLEVITGSHTVTHYDYETI